MISTVIPVYKKTDNFLKNLNNNIEFLKDTEVIIVNDDPQISIKHLLKNYNVKLIENNKNLGFGGSVNKGVKNSTNKYIFLLNSDVILNSDSYKRSFAHFKNDPNLFAVGFAQTEKNNEIVGKNNVYWKSGFFRHKKADSLSFGKTAWAEGGSSIFSKDKFLDLGGFDDLYSPFYWEDIDLSYRAWKKGYKILFDPNVLVNHHHESTISTYFSAKTIKRVSYRNQFIFIWKNITDPTYLLSHLLLLIPNLLFFAIKGEFEILSGFFMALFQLDNILKKRAGQKKTYLLTDKEVINTTNEK